MIENRFIPTKLWLIGVGLVAGALDETRGLAEQRESSIYAGPRTGPPSKTARPD